MSTKLATVLADFTTQLSTQLDPAGTSATLKSATDDDAVALPAGKYFFTLDGSNSQKEHIVCDLSGLALTNIKSVSRQGVQTSGAVRVHRVGASVTLTDFAHLLYINDLLKGTTSLDGSSPLGYDAAPASLTGNQLATVAYVLSVVAGGTVTFDQQILSGQNSGEALAINDVVYFKEADAKWYKADADLTATFDALKLGINKTTAAGASVTIQVAISGPVSGFSSLTPGAKYYLSNTAGGISATPGTNSVFVGWALSATQLLFSTVDLVLQSAITAYNAAMTGIITPYAGFSAPTGWLLCDGTAVSRSTYAALFALLNPSLGAATMTIASPAVVTLTAHGLVLDDVIYFTTTGALPTGVTANTPYYVISAGLTANAFEFSATKGGAAINTSGSQSGVHTLRRSPYGVGDGSTTFNLPSMKGNVPVGRDSSQTEFNAVGETGGEKTHVLTVAELAAHTHGLDYGGNVGSGKFAYNTQAPGGGTANSNSAGSDTAHNNLQPYISLNYIIKT